MRKKYLGKFFFYCSFIMTGWHSHLKAEDVSSSAMLYAEPLRVSLFGDLNFNATAKDNAKNFKVGVYNRPVQFDVNGRIGTFIDAPISNFITLGAVIDLRTKLRTLDNMDDKFFYANEEGEFVGINKTASSGGGGAGGGGGGGTTGGSDNPRIKFKAAKNTSTDVLDISFADAGASKTEEKDLGFLEYREDAFVTLPENKFSSLYFDNIYLYLKAPFFNMKAGRFSTSEQTLALGAQNIGFGSGMNGKWKDYVNKGLDPAAAYADKSLPDPKFLTFKTTSGLFLAGLSAKPTAVSAGFNIWDFTADISYIPDTGDLANINGALLSDANNSGDYKNVLALGLQFKHIINEGYIGFSLVGERGEPEEICFYEKDKDPQCASNHHSLMTWAAGFEMKYNRFAVGYSYGSLGKAGHVRNIGTLAIADYENKRVKIQARGLPGSTTTNVESSSPSPDDYNSSYMTLGAQYRDEGFWGVSATYLKAFAGQHDMSGGKTKTELLSVVGEYFVYKNVGIYLEGDFFSLEDKTYATCTDGKTKKVDGAYYAKDALPTTNKGSVYLLGCKIKS